MKNIPLVDLKAQYKVIKKEIDSAIRSVINHTAFIGNRNNIYVRKFENDYAKYLKIEHCIACANGTDAIEIALKALGIGKDDEVIVPALTWIATSEAVSNIGATPIFVDIDPKYYTIDPTKIEEKISNKTKAILPVHLYGLPADMDPIMTIAKKHNLFVVEDCAQAHGAEYKGKKVGTFGNLGTFSFFPGKNLGAYGDAGGIVTNDSKLAEKCHLINNHGQIKHGDHEQEGRNSRMDGIQASILNAKLPFLDKWVSARRKVASSYDKLLSKNNIIIPTSPSYAKHSYHLYVIQIADRDDLKNKLSNIGIDTGIHYPSALPFLKPYRKFGYEKSDFPVASTITSKILSLPMYPELEKSHIKLITKAIIDNINHE